MKTYTMEDLDRMEQDLRDELRYKHIASIKRLEEACGDWEGVSHD